MQPPHASQFLDSNEIAALQERGVIIPQPALVCIGRDVPAGAIQAGAVLHPFCRLIGAGTRVDAGAELGPAGAVTLINSWVGAGAQIGTLGAVTLMDSTAGAGTVLGAGVSEESVFLGREDGGPEATTGFGFRTRKGTLYEEDARSAQHTDTKMTLLFPWVTLGSNLNWCDILVAGGTGGAAGLFTEIGSGCIHFNFTPRGDKATASLLGDATRGVFLDCPRLFIGGNASLLGPLSAEYGAVTSASGRLAGSIQAGLTPTQLPKDQPNPEFDPDVYGSVRRLVQSQLRFIAQLVALDAWYGEARSLLAAGQPDRETLYARAREAVRGNIEERIAKLGQLAGRMEASAARLEASLPGDSRIRQQRALAAEWPGMLTHLSNYEACQIPLPEPLRQALEERRPLPYTKAVQSLPNGARQSGKGWLVEIAALLATEQIMEKVPRLSRALRLGHRWRL